MPSPKETVKAAAKEPEFMVQVPDSRMVRKDILETLREVIIFMQGYESFRKIQEEKVATFTALKSDLKDLHVLVNTKLRKYFPRGKIPQRPRQDEEQEEKEEMPSRSMKPAIPEEEPEEETGMPMPVAQKAPQPRRVLDELDAQLKEIEGQLKNVR